MPIFNLRLWRGNRIMSFQVQPSWIVMCLYSHLPNVPLCRLPMAPMRLLYLIPVVNRGTRLYLHKMEQRLITIPTSLLLFLVHSIGRHSKPSFEVKSVRGSPFDATYCRDFSSAIKSNIVESASFNDLLPGSPGLGSMSLLVRSSTALTDLSTFSAQECLAGEPRSVSVFASLRRANRCSRRLSRRHP